MEMQEKTQADFDLETLFKLLDEALTSKDERVQNALRSLLMIVTLTRSQDDGRLAIEDGLGPLRQMQQDLSDMNRRLYNLQNELGELKRQAHTYPPTYPPTGSQPGNLYPVTGSPYPYSPNWGPNPNMPYTTSKTSSSYTLTDKEKDSIMNQIDTVVQANKTIKLTK